MQRLAARREDTDSGNRLEQRVGESRARVDQVLAVVEDDQQRVLAQVLAQALGDGLAGVLADTQHVTRGVGNQRWVANRREVDEPHTVGIAVQHVGGDLQRKPGLAEAAHAEERQQPRSIEEPLRLGELGLAPDERCRLLRQVVGRRLERAERGKILAQFGVQQLVDMFARCEVAQPHGAQIT